MRIITSLGALGLLAACTGGVEQATYSCANGPDIAVAYQEDTAVIVFPGGRSVTLTRPDPENLNRYAAPGTSWLRGSREGRLSDGGRSLICDEFGSK